MAHLQSPARARQGEVEDSNPNLDVPPFLDRRNEPTAARSWRDHIKVHPAADLFPMMSEAELRELGEDIKKHGGLISPITFVPVGDGFELLDGRNRLDAMELVGMSIDWKGWAVEVGEIIRHIPDGIDPYDFVLTANIQRRHLTDEQRRQLIAKIIKAKPAASDRAIAKQVKRDHKTVAKIRKTLESTGEVSPVETRVGADGKARNQTKAPPKPKSKPPQPPPITPEETVTDFDRRVGFVIGTALTQIEGLSRSETGRFFAALRDRLDDAERELWGDADDGVAS